MPTCNASLTMPPSPCRSEWRRVSTAHPCPVCGKPDWCGVHADGRRAICMRVASDRPARNGGWIHSLADSVDVDRILSPPKPVPKRTLDDAEGLLRRWRESTEDQDVEGLAGLLGVSVRSLHDLGAAWAPIHGAWAFPMRDGCCAITGIRLRANDGRKWAVRGSRAGLFFDPFTPFRGTLLVCEGPTDTAAAMTLGYVAVGRPSCRGQDDLLRVFLRGHVGDVVIVSDNDAPHERPDGSSWRPGLEGALDLARALRRPCRLLVPPLKDIRQWLLSGASHSDVEAAIRDAAWLNVR